MNGRYLRGSSWVANGDLSPNSPSSCCYKSIFYYVTNAAWRTYELLDMELIAALIAN